MLAADRALPARDHPRSAPARDRYKESCKRIGTKRLAMGPQELLLFQPHRLWLSAVVSLQDSFDQSPAGLYRGHTRAGMRASAASSTDVLSADSVHCEKKGGFFGYFLCTSKESDPRYSIAEAFDFRTHKNNERHPHPGPLPPAGEGEDHKLDSRFRKTATASRQRNPNLHFKPAAVRVAPRMRPPWRSMARLAMANPNPLPPLLRWRAASVRKYGSKMLP